MYQNNNIIHTDTDDEGRQQKQKTEIGSPVKERDRERERENAVQTSRRLNSELGLVGLSLFGLCTE